MTPHEGGYVFLFHSTQQLPCLGSWILKGHFELTRRPSGALIVAMYIVSGTYEIRGHLIVKCVALRHERISITTVKND